MQRTICTFCGRALVFDKYGGWQYYALTLDQTDYGTNLGPLQSQNGTTMLAANATIAGGVINGTGFEEQGTEAYAGQARDWSGGIGPVGLDAYHGYNPQSGQTDPRLLNGFDVGYSAGIPISFGDASIFARPITQRRGPPILSP